MNVATIAAEAGIRFLLQEFIQYQQDRAREAAYVPPVEVINGFIDKVMSDTPEKVEAEARSEMGLPPAPTTPGSSALPEPDSP